MHSMKLFYVQICTDIASDESYGAKYTSFNVKAYNKDQIQDQFSHYSITQLELADEVINAT